MWDDSTNDDGTALATNGSARNASRRKRTSFSKEHVELLRNAFKTDPYPGISVRERLSQQTSIPESRIQVWFQNRRARTLKGGGAKKALWQATTPPQDAFSPPRANEGPRGAPPAYQPQIMQDMDSNFYYGQPSPPVYQNGQNHRQCGAVFAPQGGLLGGMSSAPARSCWPQQQGCSQAPPTVTPAWCQAPPNGGSKSRQEAFRFLAPVPDPQAYVAPSVSPLFKPHTPDSGLGDKSLENSPKRESVDSALEDLWSIIAQEEWAEQGGLEEGQRRELYPPLVELSLNDILEELEEDWLEGELKNAVPADCAEIPVYNY